MAPEVFYSVCYGTKTPPEVVKGLHTFTPAILRDHCRHRVKDADYPAVVPEKGHSVRGIYASGLTDANLHKLDCFEGAEYERVTAQVEVLGSQNGQQIVSGVESASVYVFLLPELLEKREWDFEEFRRDKMAMWTRAEWAYNDEGKLAERGPCRRRGG